MSSFTIKLKDAIAATGGTTELMSNGITKLSGGDIGIQYYPIFNEAYRDTLTGKIIDHYWNNEIGFETIDIFKMKMRTRLNEIMPYYNKLYNTELITIDPLKTMDMTTIVSVAANQRVVANSEVVTSSTSGSKSRSVQSDTPQVMLGGNKDYASSAADANSDSTADSENSEDTSSESNATNNSESTVSGYQGSPSDLLIRFRETILNIDLAIINDLEELFMLVYDNGDTYTNSEWRYFL